MKKYRRVYQIFTFLIAVCLFFSCVSVFAAASPKPPETLYQQDAIDADIALLNSFAENSDGSYVYPSHYGGRYVEGNTLMICVTDLSEQTLSYYDTALQGHEAHYQFVQVDHSYNELTTASEEIAAYYEQQGISVTKYAVDQSENCINLGVSPEDLQAASAIQQQPLSVRNAVPTIPVNIQEENYSNTETTLYGGAPLYNQTADALLTLGVCGTFAGDSAILTCGHGNQGLDDVMRYSNASGAIIGSVTYHNYVNGGTGDYEIVTITNASFTTSKLIRNLYNVSGVYSNPAEGIQLVKCGKNSTMYTVVSVEETDVTQIQPNSVRIRGLTRCAILTGTSVSGDSGGPYFKDNGSTVLFCGVHSSHTVNTATNTDIVYFTPWKVIARSGFSVKTN